MALCLINSGLTVTCTKLLQAGGSKPRFWAFNLDDLTAQVDVTSTTAITALTFDTYKGLYVFEGPPEGHTFGWEEVVAAGGNKAIKHNAIVKLISGSNADNSAIRALLAGSKLGFIAEHNNRTFRIYGAQSGMQSAAGTQSQGQNNTADVSDVLTFAGNGEEYLPLYFLDTDYATTLAKLVGYEV